MIIYLGPLLPEGLKQSTRGSNGSDKPFHIFDFASDGVYQAREVTSSAGGLLPHLFTLTVRENRNFLGLRFVFCGTFPRISSGGN
jgi:hypothetical protein